MSIAPISPLIREAAILTMEGVALKSVGAGFRLMASETGIDPIKPKDVFLREASNLGIIAGVTFGLKAFVKGSHFKLLMLAYFISEALSWGLVMGRQQLEKMHFKNSPALETAAIEQVALSSKPSEAAPTPFSLASRAFGQASPSSLAYPHPMSQSPQANTVVSINPPIPTAIPNRTVSVPPLASAPTINAPALPTTLNRTIPTSLTIMKQENLPTSPANNPFYLPNR